MAGYPKALNYFELLKKSFVTPWQLKTIWLFGVLLSIADGEIAGSNARFAYRSVSLGGTTGITNFVKSISKDYVFGNMESFLAIAILSLIVFGIMLAALSALFSGSLIRLAADSSNGQTLGFKQAIKAGRSKMLSIIGISLIIGIPATIIILALLSILIVLFIFGFLPAIEYMSLVWKIALGTFAAITGFLVVLLIIFSVIVISIVSDYAERFIVLEDKKALESIGCAWSFIKKHSFESTLAWLTKLVAGIAYSIALATPIMILVILSGVIAHFNQIAGSLFAFAFILLMIIPNGYWASFGNVFWTNVYLELRDSDCVIQLDQSDDSLITATEQQGLIESEKAGNNILNKTTNETTYEAISETTVETANETAGETRPADGKRPQRPITDNDRPEGDR